jgi:hypothetical protein
VPRPQES